MNPIRTSFKKAFEELEEVLKEAEIANEAFESIFGKCTAREDRERTAVEAMREEA